MNNQKLENLLNLALDADENERERSEILDVGYDPIEKEWELIVKYSGDIDMIRPLVVDMTVLLNEYMIVTVRESVIDQLSAIPQVEYIEKPKRLYFQIANVAKCLVLIQYKVPGLVIQERVADQYDKFGVL